MRNIIFSILVCLAVLEINAQYTDISTNRNSSATILGPAGDTVTQEQYDKLLQERKALLKHVRDSIDAIPFDTTRDDRYWERAITNGEWSFFTDPKVKKPFPLNLAYKAYKFYSKAFNDYDTSYVAGIDKDWKLMIINNDWLDSYGGIIADKNMKVFMNSNVSSSMGIHFSYMGIGYTYMFDLDNVFGGDPTKHSKWDISFETSRFSFEAYKSRNDGKVNIQRFGDYRNGRDPGVSFMGLSRKSSGFDLYYFFNNRKYSQAAAYSYSKIQKRSALAAVLYKGNVACLFFVVPYRVNGFFCNRRATFGNTSPQESSSSNRDSIVFADASVIGSVKKLLRCSEFAFGKWNFPCRVFLEC